MFLRVLNNVSACKLTKMNTADMIGVIILTILDLYFLWRMDKADLIIDVLKWGLIMVVTTIQLSGLMGRSRE